jgi:hypothetical protein
MTPVGIFRRLPYYYIGYVMGRKCLFKDINFKKDIIGFACLIPLSILFFYLHLHEERTLPHVILFYPFNICFLCGFLYACKLLSNFSSDIITNISVGTLLIIGLHFPLIGAYNYILKISSYEWYEALPTALFITVILYPLIIYSKNHIPSLLGK